MHEGEAKKQPNLSSISSYLPVRRICVHAGVVSMSEKEITFCAGVFMINMTAAILSFAKHIYCTKIFLFWNIVSAWCLVLKIKDAHP